MQQSYKFFLKYLLRQASDQEFMLHVKQNSIDFCIFAKYKIIE